MSSQLYPEVIDTTVVGPAFAQVTFLPVGIEGQSDAGGTAAALTPVVVTELSQADTLFGPASLLAGLVKFVLLRGVPQVTAVVSKKGSAPLLADRQSAWEMLSENPAIRIRLTDSEAQTDLVALADSVEAATLINNKQIAFGGMATATSITGLTSAATAIISNRFVLVAPAVYDQDGVLQGGSYSAAAVAAEVSKNPDISDDLDLSSIPGFVGVEKESSGMPLFRLRVTGGTRVNDFETLLDGGVSPLQQNPDGGVDITHLRTTFTTDTTFDSLATRLIVDQVFIDVRDYVLTNNYLRRGNTEEVREDIREGVEALLQERNNWIKAKTQPDGSEGYGVAVTASLDQKQVNIAYSGVVQRGIQTVVVNGQLEIAA